MVIGHISKLVDALLIEGDPGAGLKLGTFLVNHFAGGNNLNCHGVLLVTGKLELSVDHVRFNAATNQCLLPGAYMHLSRRSVRFNRLEAVLEPVLQRDLNIQYVFLSFKYFAVTCGTINLAELTEVTGQK